MKNLVILLLVAVMLLSFGCATFAANFADTTNLSKDAQADIIKLNALNIINGYPDGTFKPDKTITRAEFAKIAVILAGMEKSADVLANSPSQFTDVKTGVWYTGWVNLAASQGYVKGYTDGTFRPNAEITNAQVVTVLLRVLGYNDNLPGPWPVDYIAKAATLDVTENVDFDANAPATRASVAIMATAVLDCDVMNWDADHEEFADKNSDETTLLEENFDGAMEEDYMFVAWKYDDGVYKINLSNNSPEDGDLPNGWYDLESPEAIHGLAPTPYWHPYHNFNFIYNGDNEEIVFLEITSKQIQLYGDEFSYDSAKKEFEISDEKHDKADNFIGTSIKDYDENVTYRAHINEDNEVYLLYQRPDTNPGIVDEYDANTGKLTLITDGDFKTKYDLADKDVLLESNGRMGAPLTAIKKGDVVYVFEDKFGIDILVETFSPFIMVKSGKLNAYYPADEVGEIEKIKIDGIKYHLNKDAKLSLDNGKEFEDVDLENLYGENIKFVTNYASEVSLIISDVEEKEESSVKYGVVTEIVDIMNTTNKITEIKVTKSDGNETSYIVDTDEVELDYSNDELEIDDFIKFSVNENNEIDDLTVLAQWDGTDVVVPTGVPSDYVDTENNDYVGTIQDADSDNDRIKFNGNWYYITDETVVLNGDLNDTADDAEADIEDDADVLDWAEDISSAVQAYVQYDGNDIEYIYLHTAVSASEADYAAIIDTYVMDGDKWVDVDIMGETKGYELKDSSFPVIGGLYKYSISNDKFDFDTKKFDPIEFKANAVLNSTDDPASVAANVYCQVTDVDVSRNSVEINGVWFFADEDTVIYDFSDFYEDGDDPDYCDAGVADISEDDYIIFIDNGDNENVAKLFYILNNINE